MLHSRSLVLAKYPEAGRVKTRMVPPLTPQEAAALHRACLAAVCERLRVAGTTRPVLVCTPDARVDDLGRIVGENAAACWPQGDGDLGERLIRATGRAFGEGARRVWLFGADSPTVPIKRLRALEPLLDDHDAVLGPCEDGGYYLLGLRRFAPELFSGIDWGGPEVADQTRARARSAGMTLTEVEVWYDLDRFGDLQRAAADLAAEAHHRGLVAGGAISDAPRAAPGGDPKGASNVAPVDLPATEGLRRLINELVDHHGNERTHRREP